MRVVQVNLFLEWINKDGLALVAKGREGHRTVRVTKVSMSAVRRLHSGKVNVIFKKDLFTLVQQ